MRPCRRHKFWVDGLSGFVLPVYTLLLMERERWLTTNFSSAAMTGPDRFWAFALWAVLVGGYFALTLTGVCRTLPRPSRPYGLVLAACLAFTGTVILPYLPGQRPRAARAHVLMSFGASILIMAAVLLVLLQCRQEDRRRGNRHLAVWWVIALASVMLYLAGGKVTGALEVWFVLTSALLVRSLWLSRM